MDTAKIDLKVLARSGNGSEVPAGFDPQRLIPVFHRWIQQQELEELMIDVADYSHVPDGPSVILICHDAHYGLDRSDGEIGLLYSRRRETHPSMAGVRTLRERLGSVLRSALTACAKLEAEESLGGELSFPADRFRLRVNDRRVGEESAAVLEGELRKALAALVGDASIEVELDRRSSARLSLRIEISEALGCGVLLERLMEHAEAPPSAGGAAE